MKTILKLEYLHRKPDNYKTILKYLMLHDGCTIPEISKHIGISVPTTTKIITDLMSKGFVASKGKRDQTHGRLPTVYGLSTDSGYFLGIDPSYNSLAMALCDFSGNIVFEKNKIPFQLENTQQCLDTLLDLINEYIGSLDIQKESILHASMNVSGRVNPFTGVSHSIFDFLDQPLAKYISDHIGIPTCIENDTRAMTFGEYLVGCCKSAKNVLFVNASWGIAIGIIVGGKIYYGKSGFSGEFGHVKVYDNEVLCRCGKKGCLETEVSGMALLRETVKNVLKGKRSILSDKVLKENKELTLSDVLYAIQKEDTLCIETLQKIADQLGRNLAGMINIFNPDMLIIGGDLSQTGDYITQPVQMAIKKYSLNIVNEDSEVVTSILRERAGVVGACMVARYQVVRD